MLANDTSFISSLRAEQKVARSQSRQVALEIEDQGGCSPLTSPAARAHGVRRGLIRNEQGVFLTSSTQASLRDAVSLLNNLKQKRWQPEPRELADKLPPPLVPQQCSRNHQHRPTDEPPPPPPLLKQRRRRRVKVKAHTAADVIGGGGGGGGSGGSDDVASSASDDPPRAVALLLNPLPARAADESDDDFEAVTSNTDLTVQLSSVAMQGSWDGGGEVQARRASHAEFSCILNPPGTLEEARKLVLQLCAEMRVFQQRCRDRLRKKNQKCLAQIGENSRLLTACQAIQQQHIAAEATILQRENEYKDLKEHQSQDKIRLESDVVSLRLLFEQSEQKRTHSEKVLLEASATMKQLSDKMGVLQSESDSKSVIIDEMTKQRTMQTGQLSRKIAEIEALHDENSTLFSDKLDKQRRAEETLVSVKRQLAATERELRWAMRTLQRQEVQSLVWFDPSKQVQSQYHKKTAPASVVTNTPAKVAKQTPPGKRSSTTLSPLDFTCACIAAPLHLLQANPLGASCRSLVATFLASFNETLGSTHAKLSALWVKLSANRDLRKPAHDALREYLTMADRAKSRLRDSLGAAVAHLAEEVSSASEMRDAKVGSLFSEALRRMAEGGGTVDMVGYQPATLPLEDRESAAVDKFVSRLVSKRTPRTARNGSTSVRSKKLSRSGPCDIETDSEDELHAELIRRNPSCIFSNSHSGVNQPPIAKLALQATKIATPSPRISDVSALLSPRKGSAGGGGSVGILRSVKSTPNKAGMKGTAGSRRRSLFADVQEEVVERGGGGGGGGIANGDGVSPFQTKKMSISKAAFAAQKRGSFVGFPER